METLAVYDDSSDGEDLLKITTSQYDVNKEIDVHNAIPKATLRNNASLDVAMMSIDHQTEQIVRVQGKEKEIKSREDIHNNLLRSAHVNVAIFNENFHTMKEIDKSEERERNLVEASLFPPPPPLENRRKLPKLPPLPQKKQRVENNKRLEDRIREGSRTGPWIVDKNDSVEENIIEEEEVLPIVQQSYLKELEDKRMKAIEAFEKMGEGLGAEYIEGAELLARTSTSFHGEEEIDFMGRSWFEPSPLQARLLDPKNIKLHGDLTEDQEKCFLPKKKLFSVKAHKRGIQNLMFYPYTGHLLLSSGLDGYCKIWGLKENVLQLKREIVGHKTAIRCIDFVPSGRRFLSTGYDGSLVVWNLETGKTSGAFRCRDEAIFFQARFHPEETNIILAACGNSKVLQFDLREKKAVLEYNNHQAPVNTVTFYDNNNKFASSGDDKQLLTWEYGLPVPSQQLTGISTMSSLKLHPEGKFMAGQTLDNTISIFSADPSRIHKQRTISGHKVTGHSIEFDFSPDGQYIVSGDTYGSLYGYDWKTSKTVTKIRGHRSGACVGLSWNPYENSKLATGGWDGTIIYWG